MSLHGPIRYCHKPRDVLEGLIQRGIEYVILTSVSTHDKPGGLLATLSPENREMLQGLRSDDIARQRSMPHLKGGWRR